MQVSHRALRRVISMSMDMAKCGRVRHYTLGATSHHNMENYSLIQSPEERLDTDRAIRETAQLKPQIIHLHDLVKYKDVSPVPQDYLLQNAAVVIGEVTVRLARRLDAMQRLPYLAVLNPYISRIYNIYYNSFRVMSAMPPPETPEENSQFVEVLQSLVAFHLDTIPTLAKGFSECGQLLSPSDINRILGEHLQARIGTRLLAEHHISLTRPIGPNFIGCIQKDLSPAEIINSCASVVGEMCNLQFGFAPDIKFDMGTSVKLAYPPNHLEYIIMELLKNAFRAVCQTAVTDECQPILATVIQSGQGVIIRLRDRGGGIPPENERDVFNFSYTTVEDAPQDPSDATLAGLGYGLPLSKAYAEFFGGRLQLQSYFGGGTDVYLTLKSPLITGYHRDVETS